MTNSRLVCVLSVFLVVSFVATARADLHCPEATVALGEVKAGQPLRHRFTIVNAGRDAVEVSAVQPSCGCLKPRMEEKRLRPGDSAVLVLEVNTLTAPAGPNAWRVQILYTCDGQARDLTLNLHATVVSEISVQPAALILQTESAIGADVIVTDARAKPLTVTGVRTTDPLLRAAVREVRSDDSGRMIQVVRVNVPPEFPDGRHEEMLQIFSSDPEYAELRVPVTVVKQSRSEVSATPAEVTIHGTVGPLPAPVILLRPALDQDVEVASIECADAAVRCTHARGPGHMATVRVRIDPKQVTADGVHTVLRIRLARPEGTTLTVPVNCTTK
jgi:hypothetical protein